MTVKIVYRHNVRMVKFHMSVHNNLTLLLEDRL